MRLQLKIINLFLQDLNKSYTINEIAKLLKETYSFTNKVVNSMIKERIIKKETVGHSYHCRINLKSDKAKALTHLVEVNKKQYLLKNKEISLLVKDLITEIKKLFDKNLIFSLVFGSYANNTYSKQSDVDVLIVVNRKKQVTDISKNISSLYGKEANIIQMTLKEFRNQFNKPIIQEIIKNHVVLQGFEDFIKMIFLLMTF